MLDAKSDDRRFGFGENWLDFARHLDDGRIAEAERSVRVLVGSESLAGLRFVDIGSGSGLFSLAARRLGARVHSFDYDPASVACTEKLRELHRPGDPDWTVERASVLDRNYLYRLGTFDIVYSWGVLHHTGAMYDALAAASSLLAPSGLFAFALYRRTLLCPLWRLEKRWYAGAAPQARQRSRAVYVALLRLRFRLVGRDFDAFVDGYRSGRGMDFEHDVHDWMGGYPYESISPAEVAGLMQRLGLTHVGSNTQPGGVGLFGSGCDEYVYRRAG
jgi:SAM-dependent methyltransferase